MGWGGGLIRFRMGLGELGFLFFFVFVCLFVSWGGLFYLRFLCLAGWMEWLEGWKDGMWLYFFLPPFLPSFSFSFSSHFISNNKAGILTDNLFYFLLLILILILIINSEPA